MTLKETITKKIIFKIIKERFINEVPYLQLLGVKVEGSKVQSLIIPMLS